MIYLVEFEALAAVDRAWTPADLTAGAGIWLDADDASTMELTGGILTWQSKGTIAGVATATSVEESPILTEGGLGGRSVLSFDGADRLDFSPALVLPGDVIAVFHRQSQNASVAAVGGGYNRGLFGSAPPSFSTHTAYGIDGAEPSGSANAAAGDWFIVSGTGNQITDSRIISIGSDVPSYTGIDGAVAEIIVANGEFGLQDRQRAEGYLAHKWGLADRLPLLHPYRYEAPRAIGAMDVITERFATSGYTTGPADDPSDTHFEERVVNPGSIERAMFSTGQTSGQAAVGYGLIEIAIGDDGGGEMLDRLADHAVDGRPITIYGLETTGSAWSEREVIFRGTMEQIELDWTTASVRIRDRLADLQEPIQEEVYAGTTIAGGMDEAEGGPEDLKDRPKPMLWGTARNIPAVLANKFDRIYQVSSGPISIEAVYDRGVPLTEGVDHATLAALRSATIAGGVYDTCLVEGLLRVAANPDGDLTVDASEGAPGERTAAEITRRILIASGFTAGSDFAGDDLDALDAAATAEVGIWLPAQPYGILPVLTQILDSVGAYIVPNRLGVLRSGLFLVPAAGGPVLDRNILLDEDGGGITRIVTGDQGRGVPAHKVTIEYAPSYLVQQASALDNTAVSDEQKAFVSLEYRQVTAEDTAVKGRHLLASELFFQTLIADEASATAEAARRLAIYGTRRERYQFPVKTEIATEFGLDLGDAVTLQIDRFGLDDGKPFLVIGITTDLENGVTTLDLYG